ncbi:MAG: hypothetical protein UV54_C0044G0010 [Candidatus Beckwithbacteria bacterium GW2011_GWA2_43_10]|uniref:Uncharacterized protein n=1 Tax=Candidatus Beckwithbacteria bacterium GW2011_GWA2_43_10 TaxID=1618369 RepID=A0A0G1E7J7_9BACT|nr:MAG: hypothetical protein UV54_C0044G0010 [Candidatus Beckwithbacteria bacterium GW2011_GWA2_43_10]
MRSILPSRILYFFKGKIKKDNFFDNMSRDCRINYMGNNNKIRLYPGILGLLLGGKDISFKLLLLVFPV